MHRLLALVFNRITVLLDHGGIESLAYQHASYYTGHLGAAARFPTARIPVPIDKTHQAIQKHVDIPPHQRPPLFRRLGPPRARDRMQNLVPQRTHQTRLFLFGRIDGEGGSETPYFGIALFHLQCLSFGRALHEVGAGTKGVSLGDSAGEEIGQVREEGGEEVGKCLVPACQHCRSLSGCISAEGHTIVPARPDREAAGPEGSKGPSAAHG